jgi:hypothetical protein
MKKKTLKRLLFIFIFLIASGAAGLFYLNKVVLPIKIKSLIIQNLENYTRKKVSLESVRFSLLKGLILQNLALSDGQKTLISVKEASCVFLILPIFKEKRIIIPLIKLRQPRIFLNRRADNSINLIQLVPEKKAEEKKQTFGVIVLGINVSDGYIDFQDDTFSPAFSKSIEDVNLGLRLDLPTGIRCNFTAKAKAAPPILVDAHAEFRLLTRELNAKISIRELPPEDFSLYYSNSGLVIKDGKIDALINLNLKMKENSLTANITAQNKNIVLSRDRLLLKLNSDIKTNLQYSLADKQLKYSGIAEVTRADFSGIEALGEINNIRGKIKFNDSGISSEKFLASVFGLPIEAKINLADFKNPRINLSAGADFNLKDAQVILVEKFKVNLPAELSGQGKLSLDFRKMPAQAIPEITGSLELISAQAKIDRIALPLKDINGTIKYSQDKLQWSNLSFSYMDSIYKTSGALADLRTPRAKVILSSDELLLKTHFRLKEKVVEIAKMEGRYLNSWLFVKGNINIADPQAPQVDLNLELDIDLKDLYKPLAKFKNQLEQIKAKGLIKAKIILNGSIGNPKYSKIRAELSSSTLSLYGLKADKFFLNYAQADGIADIPLIHLSLYDGFIEAAAKINLDSENQPFWTEGKINDIKIEKLKLDTPFKDKDSSGTIRAIAKVSGFLKDISRLSGAGKIQIENGKLWELNLFKGLGKLLFRKDFTDIVFSDGYCEFFIKDKAIFTDKLMLKSSLVNLEGRGKIGFDSALDVSLNVQMSDELVPETGSVKDIAAAIMGQAGRFATIKLSGTLQKPEYQHHFTPVDVLKGLKDTIMGSIFGQ